MLDNAQSSNRSPAWWQDDHEGGWQRVRSAMKRDWEQTKADLTAGRKGADLNQNVGDTVGQALGKQATPGPSTPNAMNAAELETHVRKAARSQDREAARWAKGRGAGATRLVMTVLYAHRGPSSGPTPADAEKVVCYQ